MDSQASLRKNADEFARYYGRLAQKNMAPLWEVMRKGSVGNVYNIGGDSQMKNIDVVRLVLRALGKPDSLIRFVADRPGHEHR